MSSYVKSTWREQRVLIKNQRAVPIYFHDTKPNHILFANPSPHQLFVSVSSGVSDTTFDMIIPAYGTRLYAREMGVKEIYAYLNGTKDYYMTVTSWEGDFNPASINQSQEIVTAGASGILGTVDVANLLNPLPAGTNKIGIVSVDNLPPSGPLPEGNNKIGKVEITNGTVNLGASLPTGENFIGYVGIQGEIPGGGGGGGSSTIFAAENPFVVYGMDMEFEEPAIVQPGDYWIKWSPYIGKKMRAAIEVSGNDVKYKLSVIMGSGISTLPPFEECTTGEVTETKAVTPLNTITGEMVYIRVDNLSQTEPLTIENLTVLMNDFISLI